MLGVILLFFFEISGSVGLLYYTILYKYFNHCFARKMYEIVVYGLLSNWLLVTQTAFTFCPRSFMLSALVGFITISLYLSKRVEIINTNITKALEERAHWLFGWVRKLESIFVEVILHLCLIGFGKNLNIWPDNRPSWLSKSHKISSGRHLFIVTVVMVGICH